MADHGNTFLEIYDATVGQKYRIIAQYQNKHYPIFWFQVSQDGSIYCSPAKKPKSTKEIYIGSSQVNENGVVEFNIDNMRQTGIPLNSETVKSFKTSFHGSGIINQAGSSRVYRPSIRQIDAQSELFVIFFAKPSSFDEIYTFRKADIPLRLCLSSEYPLFMQATISKPGKTAPLVLPYKNTDIINMIFEYTGINELDTLNLQLSFAMPEKGNWPDLTIFAYKAHASPI